MQYTVTARSNRHYQVIDDRRIPVGTIDYRSWLPVRAQITTSDGNMYGIVAKGFWQVARSITKNGLAYAVLKGEMGGKITLSFENGRTCIFKKKSNWRAGSYVLINDTGTEIANVQSDFKWRQMSFGYDIEVHTHLLDKEAVLVMPLLLIYAARYLRSRQAAAS